MGDNKIWYLVELTDGFRGSLKPNTTRKLTLKYTRLTLLLMVSPKNAGINYKQTFFPFSKKNSLIILLGLVGHYDLEFHQMNV